MTKRILLNFFGQLRFWDLQDTDKWIEYIKKVQKIQNHLTD